jgi:hypothetical protein
MATGRIAKVYPSTQSQYNASISGSRVIWSQNSATGKFIYVKNLITGISGRLTP